MRVSETRYFGIFRVFAFSITQFDNTKSRSRTNLDRNRAPVNRLYHMTNFKRFSWFSVQDWRIPMTLDCRWDERVVNDENLNVDDAKSIYLYTLSFNMLQITRKNAHKTYPSRLQSLIVASSDNGWNITFHGEQKTNTKRTSLWWRIRMKRQWIIQCNFRWSAYNVYPNKQM